MSIGEICVITLTFMAAVLVFYLVKTLLKINETLKKVDNITDNVNKKVVVVDDMIESFKSLEELSKYFRMVIQFIINRKKG